MVYDIFQDKETETYIYNNIRSMLTRKYINEHRSINILNELTHTQLINKYFNLHSILLNEGIFDYIKSLFAKAFGIVGKMYSLLKRVIQACLFMGVNKKKIDSLKAGKSEADVKQSIRNLQQKSTVKKEAYDVLMEEEGGGPKRFSLSSGQKSILSFAVRFGVILSPVYKKITAGLVAMATPMLGAATPIIVPLGMVFGLSYGLGYILPFCNMLVEKFVNWWKFTRRGQQVPPKEIDMLARSSVNMQQQVINKMPNSDQKKAAAIELNGKKQKYKEIMMKRNSK